jgi:hypothetical protein
MHLLVSIVHARLLKTFSSGSIYYIANCRDDIITSPVTDGHFPVWNSVLRFRNIHPITATTIQVELFVKQIWGDKFLGACSISLRNVLAIDMLGDLRFSLTNSNGKVAGQVFVRFEWYQEQTPQRSPLSALRISKLYSSRALKKISHDCDNRVITFIDPFELSMSKEHCGSQLIQGAYHGVNVVMKPLVGSDPFWGAQLVTLFKYVSRNGNFDDGGIYNVIFCLI